MQYTTYSTHSLVLPATPVSLFLLLLETTAKTYDTYIMAPKVAIVFVGRLSTEWLHLPHD